MISMKFRIFLFIGASIFLVEFKAPSVDAVVDSQSESRAARRQRGRTSSSSSGHESSMILSSNGDVIETGVAEMEDGEIHELMNTSSSLGSTHRGG